MGELLRKSLIFSAGLGIFATACAHSGEKAFPVSSATTETKVESSKSHVLQVKGLARGERVDSVRIIKPEFDAPQRIDLTPTSSTKEPEDLGVIYVKEYSDTLGSLAGISGTNQEVGLLFTASDQSPVLSVVIFDRTTERVTGFSEGREIAAREKLIKFVSATQQVMTIEAQPLPVPGKNSGVQLLINQPSFDGQIMPTASTTSTTII